jgi:sulfatase modifying factor 1
MSLTLEQFGKVLINSGLVTAVELKRLWALLPPGERPSDAEALARILVERKRLTRSQATRLLAERPSVSQSPSGTFAAPTAPTPASPTKSAVAASPAAGAAVGPSKSSVELGAIPAEPSAAGPPPKRQRGWRRFSRRMKLLVGTALVGGSVAAAGATFYFVFRAAKDLPKALDPVTEQEAQEPKEPKKRQTVDVTAQPTGTAAAPTAVAATEPMRPLPPAIVDGPPPAKAPFKAAQARAHQEAWAARLSTTVEMTNSLGMKLVLIPPGEFVQGTPRVERDDLILSGRLPAWVAVNEPQYPIMLTRPFWCAATEVTIGQFKQFADATGYKTEAEKAENKSFRTPGYVTTDETAATLITWNDAVAFCEWLTKQETTEDGTAGVYRLPTEAEWEFACRAGTTTAYSFGDEARFEAYGWSKETSWGRAQQVGKRLPNPFGLYDMHGNVWEWCADRYSDDPKPSDPRDPAGPAVGGLYVCRSGAWALSDVMARSAFRVGTRPSHTQDNHHGFRVVRDWRAVEPAIVAASPPETAPPVAAPTATAAPTPSGIPTATGASATPSNNAAREP